MLVRDAGQVASLGARRVDVIRWHLGWSGVRSRIPQLMRAVAMLRKEVANSAANSCEVNPGRVNRCKQAAPIQLRLWRSDLPTEQAPPADPKLSYGYHSRLNNDIRDDGFAARRRWLQMVW